MTYRYMVAGRQIEQYIDSFMYINMAPLHIAKFAGFLKPKEEFEEYFSYIVDWNRSENSYKEMLKAEPNLSYKRFVLGFIDNSDTFVFDFPDEDTALYFQMKFLKE